MIPTDTLHAVKLYQCDYKEVLPFIYKDVDTVLTDPPYGISNNADYTRFTGGLGKSTKFNNIVNDDKSFDPSPLLAFKNIVLWGANCYSNRLPCGSWLVWCKKKTDAVGKFLSDCEVAWCNNGHGVYLYHYVWDGFDRDGERGKTLHPNQKPVALMKWVLNKLPNVETVFDPFMGSGPIALACIELGKRYIGCEIDPTHYQTAKNRIRKALSWTL